MEREKMQINETKEALLKIMAGREVALTPTDIKTLADAYAILCDTEHADKIADAQIRGGCFNPHEPPNEFDEEIG